MARALAAPDKAVIKSSPIAPKIIVKIAKKLRKVVIIIIADLNTAWSTTCLPYLIRNTPLEYINSLSDDLINCARMTNLYILIPPEVDPAHPPIKIKKKNKTGPTPE